MSRNSTRPTEVSVDEFIASVDSDQRRQDCRHLRTMIERATGEPAVMWGPSMIGSGSYRYRYESGREGDMFGAGFSPRSGKIALYLTGGQEGREDKLAALGRHTTGKSCVYIKTLDGLDLDVLADLFVSSVARAKELDIRPAG
jgi:hypothetical protein